MVVFNKREMGESIQLLFWYMGWRFKMLEKCVSTTFFTSQCSNEPFSGLLNGL